MTGVVQWPLTACSVHQGVVLSCQQKEVVSFESTSEHSASLPDEAILQGTSHNSKPSSANGQPLKGFR